MTQTRPAALVSSLLWFGLLGAPLAWTAQLVVGYGVEEANCSPAGESWSLGQPWQIGITATAAAIALAAGLGAFTVWRDLRRHDHDPSGRLGFMAAGGLLVSSVFLVLIVLGGVGAIVLDSCEPG